jgi:mannose-6-phosphate isomerase-like protein (cupin superfamily)
MGYRSASLDDLGAYGFRKIREALGVTAFGVNAFVVPPGGEGVHHYHDEQDELYFVHAGTARFDVDGDVFELGPGGVVHVESTTPRKFSNAGDDDLVLLIVGGKGGYVGRDGHLVDPAELEKRQALSRGEFR